MTRPNLSTALAEVVIDELVRNGVGLAVISPGSRSAALAIAAAGHPRLDTVVALDERSAAFHALGRAKAGGGPAVVISTSGTAPANWFPALIEADMSMTPLVLVSADRPPELRGVGANQTIDQVDMFGSKVRQFAEIDGGDDESWRRQVCQAMAIARSPRPGPVHLNIPFREPTVPVSDDGRSRAEPYRGEVDGRAGGLPWEEAAPAELPRAPVLPAATRGLVIAGDGSYDRDLVLQLSSALGWPVLGTALSGTRGAGVIDSYHHLLAGDLPDALIPEVVVAIGSTNPSSRLDGLVAMAATRVRVDAWGRTIDPGGDATHVVHADPADLLRSMGEGHPDGEWVSGWENAATVVRAALISDLEARSDLTGAGVADLLSRIDWGCLVAASSLPIRDVDAHVTRYGNVVANRGASGIDGLVSTALGAASARDRTVALVGDLSLLHDANGFLIDRPRDLTMIVVNNGGGGLFDSLPLAKHAPEFDRLFITPQGRDLAALARLHHLDHVSVARSNELIDAVSSGLASGGIKLVEVSVDRSADLAARSEHDAIGRQTLASHHF